MADYTLATTGNWSGSANWSPSGVPGSSSGDTATIPAGLVATLDQDVTALAGLTVTGELAWSTGGHTLNLAGNLTQDKGTLTGGPGGVLEFDNAGRTWLNNTFFGAASTTIRTVGTSASARFTVRTVAGGTNAAMTTNNFDLTKYDLHHADFVRFGNSSGYAAIITYNSRSHVVTFDDVTFDADCGQVAMLDAPTADGGWDIEDCRFDQTNLSVAGTGHKQPLALKSSAGTITGDRKVYRCVFAEWPALTGRSLDCQDCAFVKGWDDGQHAEKWATFSGAFVRLVENNGQSSNGDVADSFLLFDSGAAPVVTGTSSGGNTSTTLNDTSKSWTANAYAPAASSALYMVEITGGTGVGQRRFITGNTATGLSVAYRWDTTPDSTSTYAVIPDIPNNHGISPSDALTSGTWTVDGLVAQDGGCETQGDVVLHMDNTSVAHTVVNCLILPNAMGDSSGTLATLGNADNGSVAIEHCTAFTGVQAGVSVSEGGAGHAGALDSLKSNLFWCDPTRAAATANNTSDRAKYWANGGAYGPYALTDTDKPDDPSLGTADIISPANLTNNAAYGVLAGFEGKGYNLNLSAAPDATNLYGVDPGFAHASRSFWSWAVVQGSTAATIGGQIADGIGYLRANPTLTRTSLLPYLRAGFAPSAPALATAAHDGTTIGAVQVEAAAANTLTLSLATQDATASLGIQGTPPATTLAVGASSQPATASLVIQNTPPATTLAVAAQAQSASVSIGLNAATTPAPLTVSGLVAGWLPELISGATDGGPLDSFADASGHGHDGAAAGTQRPTYRAISINALPAVEVTADGQWFDLAAPITLPDAYTLYFCASRTGDNLLRVLANASGTATVQINGTNELVVDDANGAASGLFFGGAGVYLWRFRRSGAGQPHQFAASATAEQSIGTTGLVTLNTLLGKSGAGQSTAAGDLFAGAVLYDRDLIGTADDADIQQYFIDNRAVSAIPETNTLAVSAVAQSASASIGVQNTPPASTLAVSAASSPASVNLNLQNNAPATNAVTVTAQAPDATASLGLANVPPASTVTLSAQAQAALATLGLLNTPPASTLNVAAASGDASVSLGLTVFVGVGLTVSAQAQPASASVGVSNVPPASTLTVTASSGPASASLAASVANPVTIAVAAVSGRSSASLGATVSGAALPITLTVDAAAADATVYLFARMVDPATLPSDRLAYAAIRDLLMATREFDAVLVGRQAATTPIPAKWSTYAVLTPAGNPQLKPDGTPSMLASVASYRLLIVARAATVRDDEQAYQRADRLKGLVLGTLLSASNRSYGGICSPWLSSLRPVGDPVKVEDEWRAELVGSFAYLVNTLTGYSRSTARL